jgi:DNA recombination protein RmuC
VGEHLDTQLAHNRQEQQMGLSRTTESLEKKFQTLEEKTQQQLEAIRAKVDERLATIGKDVQTKLTENMTESFKHFEKFQQYMKEAETQLKNVGTVGESINDLNNLLKLPHLRGGFGEASLELLLADFLSAEMYELQADVGGNGRVDALVKFPGVYLPIDSKFPREQVLPLFETCDQAEIEKAREKLRQVVKKQAADIALKYIHPEAGTTDMALMFLPSETLYFEVIRNTELWNAMSEKRVYPVSPSTLAITLKSIYLAYKNYKTAGGINETIKSLQLANRHFENFRNRFLDIGTSLQKAQDAFQTANTHLENYSKSVTRLTGAELPALEKGDENKEKDSE